MSSSHVARHLEEVRQRIAKAAADASRDASSVTLLAVSKTFPAEDVRAAFNAGQRAFGENYVQEAVAKIAGLADLRSEIEWHFIGPLQSNKTKVVSENFDWVHSVDRLKIAERLNEQRPDGSPRLNVCLQINVSGEDSKSGIAPDDALALAHQIAALPRLRFPNRPPRSMNNARRIGVCAKSWTRCARTALNSTRFPWGCRRILKPLFLKARPWFVLARPSSARVITLTDFHLNSL
jgi:pyridoxal phosphate enzyme (YggS family)